MTMTEVATTTKISAVNKDLTCKAKAKAKDQTGKDKDKDLSVKAKAKDLVPKAKDLPIW